MDVIPDTPISKQSKNKHGFKKASCSNADISGPSYSKGASNTQNIRKMRKSSLAEIKKIRNKLAALESYSDDIDESQISNSPKKTNLYSQDPDYLPPNLDYLPSKKKIRPFIPAANASANIEDNKGRFSQQKKNENSNDSDYSPLRKRIAPHFSCIFPSSRDISPSDKASSQNDVENSSRSNISDYMPKIYDDNSIGRRNLSKIENQYFNQNKGFSQNSDDNSNGNSVFDYISKIENHSSTQNKSNTKPIKQNFQSKSLSNLKKKTFSSRDSFHLRNDTDSDSENEKIAHNVKKKRKKGSNSSKCKISLDCFSDVSDFENDLDMIPSLQSSKSSSLSNACASTSSLSSSSSSSTSSSSSSSSSSLNNPSYIDFSMNYCNDRLKSSIKHLDEVEKKKSKYTNGASTSNGMLSLDKSSVLDDLPVISSRINSRTSSRTNSRSAHLNPTNSIFDQDVLDITPLATSENENYESDELLSDHLKTISKTHWKDTKSSCKSKFINKKSSKCSNTRVNKIPPESNNSANSSARMFNLNPLADYDHDASILLNDDENDSTFLPPAASKRISRTQLNRTQLNKAQLKNNKSSIPAKRTSSRIQDITIGSSQNNSNSTSCSFDVRREDSADLSSLLDETRQIMDEVRQYEADEQMARLLQEEMNREITVVPESESASTVEFIDLDTVVSGSNSDDSIDEVLSRPAPTRVRRGGRGRGSRGTRTRSRSNNRTNAFEETDNVTNWLLMNPDYLDEEMGNASYTLPIVSSLFRSIYNERNFGRSPYFPSIFSFNMDARIDNDYEELIRLGEQLGDVKAKKGLVKSQISQLPTKVFSRSDVKPDNPPECNICMCEFEVDEKLRILPCFHNYHVDCIDKWIKDHPNCPICRVDVDI